MRGSPPAHHHPSVDRKRLPATALEASHDTLRGAIIFAAWRIRKLSPLRRHDPAIAMLRRELVAAREARGYAPGGQGVRGIPNGAR